MAKGQDNKAARAHSLYDWWKKHGSLTNKQWAFAKLLLNWFYSNEHQKKKTKSGDRQYYLYAISDQRSIKLGFSLDPQKRLKQLQVGHPLPLSIIWKLSVGPERMCAEEYEKKLHRYCGKYKERGEWFSYGCLPLIKEFKIKVRQEEDEKHELEIVAEAKQRI